MSTYEKYDQTSRAYDLTRVPIGGEIIIGCLACHEKPLGELVVLDAGCGTGAYARLVVDHVARVEAMDGNRAMLGVARAKLREEAGRGRVGFHEGSITELPFAGDSFDAVMVNQVLHHLDDGGDTGFPLHHRAMTEFARVLRPGGLVIVNSCSQAQLTDGCWYPHLVPRAAEALRRRFMPLDEIQRLLAEVGFAHRGSFVPVDAVCQGQAYFDGLGPLDKAWRDGDSLWALAGKAELARAQARVRELAAAGTLDAFVAKHDARRPLVGQITFTVAARV